jgi:hypothetical protein
MPAALDSRTRSLRRERRGVPPLYDHSCYASTIRALFALPVPKVKFRHLRSTIMLSEPGVVIWPRPLSGKAP